MQRNLIIPNIRPDTGEKHFVWTDDKTRDMHNLQFNLATRAHTVHDLTCDEPFKPILLKDGLFLSIIHCPVWLAQWFYFLG